MVFPILLVLPHYSLNLFYKIGLCPHQLFGFLEIHCVYQTKKTQNTCFPIIYQFSE